jgi:hypothetical protein
VYVGTGPATILMERTPCKKLADLRPRQGNLLQRNIFSKVYKTSVRFTKYRSAEKFFPFSHMLLPA